MSTYNVDIDDGYPYNHKCAPSSHQGAKQSGSQEYIIEGLIKVKRNADNTHLIQKCIGQIMTWYGDTDDDGIMITTVGTGTVCRKLDNGYVLIMTCGHNLVQINDETDKKQRAKRLWFLPLGIQEQKIRLKCIEWIEHEQYNPKINHCPNDIGIILCHDLRGFYNDINVNTFIHVMEYKKKKDVLRNCGIYGYPIQSKGKLMGMIGDAERDKAGNQWKYHTIRTYPGQSGAVIYDSFEDDDDEEEHYRIYGVHIYGNTETQKNRGVYLSHNHIEWVKNNDNKMQAKAVEHMHEKKEQKETENEQKVPEYNSMGSSLGSRREILTICVGKCGIQLGQALWEQYGAEHDIPYKGKYNESKHKKDYFSKLYDVSDSGTYTPRNIMVDLEPNIIDGVRNSRYSSLFHPQFLLSGNESEGAANNFGRGYYSMGKTMIDKINDRIRKLMNYCDKPQGIFMLHSICGGTGSGLGSLILEQFADNYKKKVKIGFGIYPEPTPSTCFLEQNTSALVPYNALLASNKLLEFADISMVYDNSAVSDIYQKRLQRNNPSYYDINRLIAKTISSVTASMRFEGELPTDLNEFLINLTFFPRLHFIFPSMAPIATPKYMHTKQGIMDLAVCFSKFNFFTKIADFDYKEDKYLAIATYYHGNVRRKEAYAVAQYVKSNKVSFVDRTPMGIKVCLCERPLAVVKEDYLAPSKANMVMFGNNVVIPRIIKERIIKKYDLMYRRGQFVNQYIEEGMKKSEFEDARENLSVLQDEYMEILHLEESEEDDESY